MVEYAALHLLIKHQGSRNPVSRRTGQSTQHVTREDAIEELKTYQALIKKEGETIPVFQKYALQRSDCGSYKKKGDLGSFGPGIMQQSFEDGVKALRPGEMSGIVESDSGAHLIFRYQPNTLIDM